MKTIRIASARAGAGGVPPGWALLERRLIDAMNDAVELVMEKYVRPDGSIMWPPTDDYTGIDGLDDAYESFFNWPLLYLLGGDDKLLAYAHRQFDAITRQFAGIDTGQGHPMVVKEYEQGYDWFHQGEGYMFFYLLGLADPHHERHRERAVRFAGFYLGEDADADNYDRQLRMMKCPHVGSRGPRYRQFAAPPYSPWKYEDWNRYYGLPFQDVPGVRSVEDLKASAKAELMGRFVRERWSRGDVPVNLACTGLVAHAYLLTGEAKYKEWVREYVEAWMERTEQNGSLIPDNIGASGVIGEHLGGKWYGGPYGWAWPHGWAGFGYGVTAAGIHASLLLRDKTYLQLPRSQMDALMQRAVVKDGTLHVPHKFGDPGHYRYDLWIPDVLYENGEASVPFVKSDTPLMWRDGWFEFFPMDPNPMAHIWHMSMEPQDLERTKRLRNHRRRDWQTLGGVSGAAAKGQSGNEQPWLSYLEGQFPDYPERLLCHNLQQVENRVRFMETDTQDPRTYGDSYLQGRNPVTVEGLVQLTLGAPMPIYNGGLLAARLRYYDGEHKRPGLPPDTAALITRLEADRTELELVNLNTAQERELIIQAGAFAEHRITWVSWRTEEGQEKVLVDDRWLHMRLAPGSHIMLELGLDRGVYDPSYITPWG